MAIKKFKPVTPGQRGMTGSTFEEITKTTPERALLKPLRKSGGRNSYGRVTVRHRGGGVRRHIRVIDYKREKFGIPASSRASFYLYNTKDEVDMLVNGIYKVKELFG